MKAFPKPAFTIGGDDHKQYSEAGFTNITQDGMLLRDYFAAKAMQAIESKQKGDDWSYELVAKHAYKIADAMIEQRSK